MTRESLILGVGVKIEVIKANGIEKVRDDDPAMKQLSLRSEQHERGHDEKRGAREGIAFPRNNVDI